jgi:cell division protein ZipA
MTVLLTVVAPAERPFRGTSILLAAQELKLRLHRSGVFDFFAEARDPTLPVFRIAHLREPGTFQLDNMGKLATPGLLVFMQLPGPLSPMHAMDQMLDVARQLGRKLGGTLCDEKRQRLSTAAILKLREEVADYEGRLGRS